MESCVISGGGKCAEYLLVLFLLLVAPIKCGNIELWLLGKRVFGRETECTGMKLALSWQFRGCRSAFERRLLCKKYRPALAIRWIISVGILCSIIEEPEHPFLR